MTDEEKIREINQNLKGYYGEPDKIEAESGVHMLVETILSQNTNDVNRDKAFQNLLKKYEDWSQVENAPREELIDTIRVAGLGPTKADRIQNALTIVREEELSGEGEYSVDFLEEMSVEEAKDWLTKIPGIGPKTAAVILCFQYKMPVIPVDTHVHRVSKRLGLIPQSASRKKAHEILEEKVPDDIKFEFHVLLIEHGREHCSARNPTCEDGPLADMCKCEHCNGEKA
jgi:endonuclease-3